MSNLEPATLLTPRQRQTLAWSIVAVLLLALLVALGPVLTPFVAALVLGYVLEPPVRRLSRTLPRAVAVLVVIVAALLAVSAVALIVVPIVQKEIELVRTQLPALVERVTGTVLPWLQERLGLRIRLDGASLRTWLSGQFKDSGQDMATMLLGTLQTGWAAAVQVLGMLFLVPVVLFFVLLDWPRLMGRFQELIPPRWRAPFHDVTGEIDGLLSQYLRGQLLVMGALAVFYSVGLLIAGFELWLPIGVLTGVLVFVPYFGFALGAVFALLAGVLQLGLLDGLIATAIVYGLGQAVESYWLTPRLVGERIGLHPLAVILALLAFGALLGFVGVLLALPLAAALAVGVRRLKARWLGSEFYRRPG